jgi:hypothetical protein
VLIFLSSRFLTLGFVKFLKVLILRLLCFRIFAMEEYQSPSVQRRLIPSPSRGTPSPSKNSVELFYKSSVPPFVLEAFDRASNSEIVDLPKHYLPNFSFRVVDGHVDPLDSELVAIMSHFPGCTGISYTSPFLVVTWLQLPVKPWPLTIGRVPLFYACPDNPRAPTVGKLGRSAPMMDESIHHLKLWQDPTIEFTKEIVQSLVERGIGLTFFGWSGGRWYAEVSSAEDGAKLPVKICGLMVMWRLYPQHEVSAQREITPDGGVVIDCSSYGTDLRPGVLIESKGRCGSTSGLPLRGLDGQQWITVAEHSFKMGDRDVHHPCYAPSRANLIANVEYTFPDCVFALAKLQPSVKYLTCSFDVDEADGTLLGPLVPSNEIVEGQSLYMDSPFNGKCEGIVSSKGFWILPEGSNNKPFRHYECMMVYFGNGADDIFPGTCGSALWTEDKEVAAIFRWYYPKDAIAYVLAVDILITSGFKLEATS